MLSRQYSKGTHTLQFIILHISIRSASSKIMSNKRKKPNELQISVKVEVLDMCDKGYSCRKIAEKYHISKSTVTNIKNQKDAILSAWENNCSENRKRKARAADTDIVNNKVFDFFVNCRNNNIPVSGPLLQTKAKALADFYQIDNFQASNGWLEKFLSRNNITFKTLCGESADVDFQAAEDWKRKVPDLVKAYALENVFNADETAFFYKQIPRKSYVQKGDPCKGGKLAKERLSVLFCCSATGEKLKPLIIGNAACPRVFKKNKINVDYLPATWRSNKKAWMTSKIFEDWLLSLNRRMKMQNRNILLIIDNAASHKNTKQLSNVVVKFLPPNLTSECQPLDQGIIRASKARYRKRMLQKLVFDIDNNAGTSDLSKSVNVLDAIRWIASAWKEISEDTIIKCFMRCGFPVQTVQQDEDTSVRDLVEVIHSLPEHVQTDLMAPEDMVSFDGTISTEEQIEASAEEIFENLLHPEVTSEHNSSGSDDEDDTSTEVKTLSNKEALNCIRQLVRFSSEKNPEMIEKLFQIQDDLERYIFSTKCYKQNRIDKYFKKN